MAIKNLLVAYNGGIASDAALRFAIQMSRKHDAHLTGVLAHGVSKISRNIPHWFSGEVRESIIGAIAHKAETIRERFHVICEGELVSGKIHWIEVGGEPDKTISDYATLFDITITGQFENLVEADELVFHPDRITCSSGRPVLVVPKIHEETRFNERVVLAWDGNKTATRALADAMMILEPTDRVTILTVEDQRTGTPLKGIDVSTVLERHGVLAEKMTVPNETGSVADSILAVCDQVSAGLLVMGAYERSKLGQDIIGGVTNTVIRRTEIPVLLSH